MFENDKATEALFDGKSYAFIFDHIDELRFGSQVEKHELSPFYEAKIKNMGNAGRNGDEYYTPRPLERAIIQVVRPQLGERIYDGALVESHQLVKQLPALAPKPAPKPRTKK